jgi:hypothetical protein
VVPDTLTLAKLDRVIQAAMGWTNSHLHEFAIDGHRYGIVDPEWDQEPDLLEDKRFRVGNVLGTRMQDFRIFCTRTTSATAGCTP